IFSVTLPRRSSGRGPATMKKDRLYGTLDALVLKTLAGGPRHGYSIAKWLEETSGDALSIEEGSLYPALYRMEKRGWIEAERGDSELGRKAKFYRLTRDGREQLRVETAEWKAFVAAISDVLLA
ncbi:MAG TPA: PadR family transcriptional regulator, partial [Vicinamibacteria bacterium]|nr:PadR family transcriptional regulator [Vicinamibacteria bacterium]